ncbi:hypothetical protein [Halobacillus sp. BAB-2008]|uniref:HAAS signaling domain-containing protein n=1 Tax=Halobacillus sp. BAB-2008 TaxID=1246484 RepID=UPI0002A4D5ED|nr:hypothetical protein [Halobacillus sp. BAB-2008]ELK48591.1 hypothetical protein D479_02317 [Halobacillus sp. BAB-2008]
MEMVDRYIYAVTQKLPESQREDIALELRTLIEDMLDDRAGERDVTEEDIEAVLIEMGSPRELAQKYRGTKNYVIGPELYDSYILVLKIALIATAATIIISFLGQVVVDPTRVIDHFVGCIVSLVTGLPTALGWTTIGFAIVGYAGASDSIDLYGGKDWKPSKLPPVPEKKRQIKRGETIFSIAFYMFLLALFAFSNEYFGIWIFKGDGFNGVVPFLNTGNWNAYLFLFLIFGFGIIKECLKLIYGRWTVQLVIYTAVVNVLSFGVLLLLINGPTFWNPDFMQQLAQTEYFAAGSEAYDTVEIIWEQLTMWIVVFMAVGLVWDVVSGWYKVRQGK